MAPEVLVVGETPSLGRAIVDLLEAGGIRTAFVLDAREAKGSFAAVVAACNAAYCDTLRAWLRGELPPSPLVLVGSRDPVGRSLPEAHLVDLPLKPESFVSLVRSML